MRSRELTLSLAKLAVAAAWADGALTTDETNVLKSLLFRLPDVSGEDWVVLSMYMESPTTKDEQQELLSRVVGMVHTEEDKALVLDTLERLFGIDGTVTAEEQALLTAIRNEVSAVGTGLFSGLGRALKSTFRQRQASQDSVLREHAAADYQRNPVYYALQRGENNLGVVYDQPEEELRKLCLAAGLLAHAAAIDSHISRDEQRAMAKVFAGDCGLSREQAALLVALACDRVSRGLDEYLLAFDFFERTTAEERTALLDTLFRIAKATDRVSYDETEEVRRLSMALKIGHEEFIAAKVKVLKD